MKKSMHVLLFLFSLSIVAMAKTSTKQDRESPLLTQHVCAEDGSALMHYLKAKKMNLEQIRDHAEVEAKAWRDAASISNSAIFGLISIGMFACCFEKYGFGLGTMFLVQGFASVSLEMCRQYRKQERKHHKYVGRIKEVDDAIAHLVAVAIKKNEN